MQIDNDDFLVDSTTTDDAFHSNKLNVSKFGHIISYQSVSGSFIHNSKTLKWSSINDKQMW